MAKYIKLTNLVHNKTGPDKPGAVYVNVDQICWVGVPVGAAEAYKTVVMMGGTFVNVKEFCCGSHATSQWRAEQLTKTCGRTVAAFIAISVLLIISVSVFVTELVIMVGRKMQALPSGYQP